MATTYKTPGVFVEEIPKLPPSVAQVETALPAFIGYTEIVRLRGMHGAKQRLFDMQGKTAETKRLIADYEQRLARAQCEWWTQLDRTQQLGKLLESLPANKFMKRIGS